MSDQHFSPARLKALREEAGVSRTAVAFVAHRSEQSVWLWERGKVKPSVETLERVASLFGCEISDFFEQDGARV